MNDCGKVVLLALHSLSLDSSSFSAGSDARVELASKKLAYMSTLAPLEADAQILYACYGVFPLLDDEDLHLKVSIFIHNKGREKRVAMFYMAVTSRLLHDARFVPHFRTFPQGDIEVLAKWRSHGFEGFGPEFSREQAILESSTDGSLPLLDWPEIGKLYKNFFSSRRGTPFIQERLDRYDTPSARRNLSRAPLNKLKHKIQQQKSQFEIAQCEVPQSIEWHFEDVSLQMSPICESFSTMSSLSLSADSESMEEPQLPFLCPRFASAAMDEKSSSDFGDFDIFNESISPAQREVMLRLHKADSIGPGNTLRVPSELAGSDSRSSTSMRVPLLDLEILTLSNASGAPVCVLSSAQETSRSWSSEGKVYDRAPVTVLVSRPSSELEALVADSLEVEDLSESCDAITDSLEVEDLSDSYDATDDSLEVEDLSESYEAVLMEVDAHPPRSKLRGLQIVPTPPTISRSNLADSSSMCFEINTKSSEFSKELRVVSSNEVSTKSSEHSPKVNVISTQIRGLVDRTVHGCQSPVFTLRAPRWQLDPQDC